MLDHGEEPSRIEEDKTMVEFVDQDNKSSIVDDSTDTVDNSVDDAEKLRVESEAKDAKEKEEKINAEKVAEEEKAVVYV